MGDEERREEAAGREPAETPAEPAEPEAAAEPGGEAGEPAEAQAPAEERATAEEEAPAEERAAAGDEGPPAEEPPAGAGEAGPRRAEPAEAEPPAKAKDLPPGAELEPIAIEPERELSAEERARLEAEAEERARREAEATAEAREEEPAPRREPRVRLEPAQRIQATGKRKSSVARVLLRGGSGAFTVNGRDLEDYFPRAYHVTLARQALAASGYEGSVDVRVRVHGGGVSGQAGAIRHGIARALTEMDPELRGELKRRGFLTRDAREKERRKAGLKKARKRPQFSKR